MDDFRTEELGDDARGLLDAMLEEFRKQVWPDWSKDEFRAAAYEAFDAGWIRIYESSDNFALRLTPEGRVLFPKSALQ